MSEELMSEPDHIDETEESYIHNIDEAYTVAEAQAKDRERVVFLEAAQRAARRLEDKLFDGSKDAVHYANYSEEIRATKIPGMRTVDTREYSQKIADGLAQALEEGEDVSADFVKGIVEAMGLDNDAVNPWVREVGQTALRLAAENTRSELYSMGQAAEFSAIVTGHDTLRRLKKNDTRF